MNFVPLDLLDRLKYKLENSVFDLGLLFELRSNQKGNALIATQDLLALHDVYLIDHMITFNSKDDLCNEIILIPSINERFGTSFKINKYNNLIFKSSNDILIISCLRNNNP